MAATRRIALALVPGLIMPLALARGASGQAATVTLYRLVLGRGGEVVIGLTPQEMSALGAGPEVERIARRIAEQGQLTAWRYSVTRAADGTTQLATRERVAVMKQEALMVEPYRPALPVAPPPAN